MAELTADLENDLRQKPAPLDRSAFPETTTEQTQDGAFRRQRNWFAASRSCCGCSGSPRRCPLRCSPDATSTDGRSPGTATISSSGSAPTGSTTSTAAPTPTSPGAAPPPDSGRRNPLCGPGLVWLVMT